MLCVYITKMLILNKSAGKKNRSGVGAYFPRNNARYPGSVAKKIL